MPEYLEIEARFLDIDAAALKQKLTELGATNFGDDLFEEIIAYSKEWADYKRMFLKIRKTKNGVFMTYKHQREDTVDGTEEIQLKIDDFEKAITFLKRLGFDYIMRHQQKKRHSFELDGVTIDIDTWPKIPTYVELEGKSEQKLKDVAAKLGLDWQKAVFENPRIVMEKYYNFDVANLTWFTFDRIE